MPKYQSHLTILESSASRYALSPAFKVPHLNATTGEVQDWHAITYRQFKHDVEVFAKYWSRILSADGIGRRSVVGLWIGGITYTDVLHIYGLSRAGYVPQLFSLRLPSPVVTFELLQKANAKALIFDSSFEPLVKDCPVTTHLAVGAENVHEHDTAEPLPEMPEVINGDETVFVFHTSGSTSGSPKLVPCSRRWLNAAVYKANQTSRRIHPERQDVSTWMGSMCHIGQTTMLLGGLQHGSCVVQPTQIAFSTNELVDIILRCGVNRLHQFPAYLANHLRNARLNSKLLAMLQSLDEVLYAGMPLSWEEKDWAYRNGLKLRNLFGSTECGIILLSVGGEGQDALWLRPLPGLSYRFLPIAPVTETESGHQSNTRLLELVILSGSGDCPDVSLRSDDGHFHTGDLFQEPQPGYYVFCGRNDDWIKSENSLRCDTKAIEENVKAMCGDVISECIVVGSGRPSPTLFVEPASDMDHEKLKKEIIRKTRQFHSRRYLHERISSSNMIVIVPPKSLPRTATKGNIRRQAVEELYKTQLDAIYGVQSS